MKKTFIQRTILVLKKVYYTPTLPQHIIDFQNNIYIRIFRFLCGLSISSLLLINKTDFYTNILGTGIFLNIFMYSAFLMIILFNFYIAYINYHRFKHSLKVLKGDDLIIRNSPVVEAATALTRFLYCAKIGCQATAFGGTILTGILGTDQILQMNGKEPYFAPRIGKLIWGNNFIPMIDKNKYLENIKINNSIKNDLISAETKLSEFAKNENLSLDFVENAKSILKKEISALDSSNKILESKVLEELRKLNK